MDMAVKMPSVANGCCEMAGNQRISG